MANHDERAPGRGVGGSSIGARAGDSVCGEISKMALVRLSGPTLSHPLTPCAVNNDFAWLCNS